jgi:hypothetical protein
MAGDSPIAANMLHLIQSATHPSTHSKYVHLIADVVVQFRHLVKRHRHIHLPVQVSLTATHKLRL